MLGHCSPRNVNELFDVATNFASGEEAVGTIFDSKKGKRAVDAPAAGSKPKDPTKGQKWGMKGKKAQQAPRVPKHDEDSDEVHAVDPAGKGARGPLEGAAYSMI